ncbi:hypothetical protein B1694_06565 [Geobacillus zalihae]|nr:hypothetical protein B1694_06565 [Geobacillus zalihae]
MAKLYEKITNCRNDFLHKRSARLIRENQVVCVKKWTEKDVISIYTVSINGHTKNMEVLIHERALGRNWRRFQPAALYARDRRS